MRVGTADAQALGAAMLRKIATSKPIRLGAGHFLLLVSILVVVAFATVVVLPDNPIRNGYWWYVVRPNVEARFGFEAVMHEDSGCIEVARITAGGAFDKAGVKIGYAPWHQSCFGFSPTEGFINGLAEFTGGERSFAFVENGCGARLENMRVVTRAVVFPE